MTSKAAKKSPAKAAKKAAPKKQPKKAIPAKSAPTKLAVVDKAAPIAMSATFKPDAAANDKAIDHEMQLLIGRSYVTLGELFRENKDKGYHVASGFNSFADYCEAKSGKSKSQIYVAMDIVKQLTSGDKPLVSKDDLKEMTQGRTPRRCPIWRSRARRSRRSWLTRPRLSRSVASKPRSCTNIDPVAAQKDAVKRGDSNGASGIAGSATTTIKIVYELLPDTAAPAPSRVVEIAKYITRDGDKETPFIDKVLRSICAEYESTYAHEYEQAKADAGRGEGYQRRRDHSGYNEGPGAYSGTQEGEGDESDSLPGRRRG